MCNENNERYTNVSLIECVRTTNHHHSHTYTSHTPIGSSILVEYCQQIVESDHSPHKQFTQQPIHEQCYLPDSTFELAILYISCRTLKRIGFAQSLVLIKNHTRKISNEMVNRCTHLRHQSNKLHLIDIRTMT